MGNSFSGPTVDANSSPRSAWWGRLAIPSESRFYIPELHDVECGDDCVIFNFHGANGFLSNFHKSLIEYDGHQYQSVEHAYQAAKATIPEWEEAIRLAETPAKAKLKGRKCPIRKDWEEVKLGIMKQCLIEKFTKHDDFSNKLLGTGNSYLVEGTVWHDNVFGICLLDGCNKCRDIVGENHLGNQLMEIRALIASGRT